MELKQKMSFEEMEKHMKENTILVPSKVSVGRYAKKLGYRVYKPMIKGLVQFFYVNENILNK